MAAIVLGALGSSLGAGFGGAILGLSGAAIGGMIGSAVGSMIDSWLIASLQPNQRIEGARLESLRITSSTEGAIVPQIFGRMRIGGNIIWATDFIETTKTEKQGGKGGGGKVITTTHSYSASFAIGICEGAITGIGRIWADGDPIDMTGIVMRVYNGEEEQNPDPLILSLMGTNRAPAYRGTAYVVFENLQLEQFGNRIPQLTFEVFRPLASEDTAEGMVKSVTLIPASGEFAYATTLVKIKQASGGGFFGIPDPISGLLSSGESKPGKTIILNSNAIADQADINVSLDRLETLAPAVDDVALVVSWFGDDLRAGNSEIKPKVDAALKATTPPWRVNGVLRADADLISKEGEIIGGPEYFGTETTHSFYAVDGQTGYMDGIVDTASITVDIYLEGVFIERFEGPPGVGHIEITINGTGNFTYESIWPWPDGLELYVEGTPSVPGTTVAYGGTPADFSVVEAIAELKARGNSVTFYPFIMMDIAASNTLPNPYSDDAEETTQPKYPWRGRITCSPAAGFVNTVDKTAAAAAQVASFFGTATAGQFNINGTQVNWTGAPTEWGYRRMILHYAHLCVAAGGVDAFLIGSELVGLTKIRSDATTYPTIAQLKTLAADVSGILGAGCKVSYAADWSEYFGHQPNDGSGDVFFHLDPLWADANIDFVGIDNYMPLSDWRDGFSHMDALVWPTIYDHRYLASNIAGGEGFDWFYANEVDRADQVRTPITDGLGKPWVFRYKDLRGWWTNQHYNRPAGVEAGTPTAWVPESKPFRFTELGCPNVDRGTNQPNVFVDAKSSESKFPYFSRGKRDDAIQRSYIEATFTYWNDAANNPLSAVYSAPMVETDKCSVWTWDARPYPFFPDLTTVWSDADNWRLGHWLTGRLGAVSLAAIVKLLCARVGYPAERIDVSGLYGAVEGYAIGTLESPRTSISVLARHFGFDAVESEGNVKFVMRGALPIATILPNNMTAGTGDQGEMMELLRAQPSDLPLSLKWNMVRADADYDAVLVEARRINVDSVRIAVETFPLAVPPEEAERRCRRALLESWVAIESMTFALPPSMLALDPADVIFLEHDGRQIEYRLSNINDAFDRKLEAVRQDRIAYDLPPGSERPTTVAPPTNYGTPEAVFMNLPQLSDTVPAFYPYIAVNAEPWPGAVISFKSPTLDGFVPAVSSYTRAITGRLTGDFYAGPVSVFDMANEVWVRLNSGTLASVTDSELFAGANAFAVESAPDVWEVFQAGIATLINPGEYKLTRLLRGQKGTEGKMGAPTLEGARIVALDLSVYPIQIGEAELTLPFNWRTGPATRPVSDPSYLAQVFTPSGEGLMTYAPDLFRQPYRTARVPGDYLIEWVRRDRSLVSDAWDLGEPPMSEGFEAYSVDIMSGPSVLRTIDVTTPSALYTAAMQTTDWGAPLIAGQSLDVRIYQISAKLGRGARFARTLYF